ncbi:ABC transporter ATP-binding protein [Cohnella thailandensis]|uniref:ABC transporter ATP-binding protein n=1 Tax=Cohnella thailandensis TaxID=557557 RepID=A0A841T2R5_9BACL|nr:ABC transporter ATP-binding protein [Cohnella thailandensis]MBB6637309.1 ABC transporter ATP-binding protein [Cohnella thailandensis]MBP1976637.1 ABC-type multidrug transport system fused ATPase/permease subunit [Cohnella thailandensis]
MRENVKFIRSVAKPHYALYFVCFLMMIVQLLAQLASTGVQQRLIDDVFLHGEGARLAALLVVFFVAALLQSAALTGIGYLFHVILFRIRYALFERAARFLQRIPASAIQNERTAKHVDVMNDYVFLSAIGIGLQLPNGFFQIVPAVALMAVVGWYSPVILVCVAGFSCCYLILGYRYGKKLKRAAHRVNDTRRDVGVFLEEGVSSTREVLAFHRMDYETSTYRSLFDKYFRNVLKEGRLLNRQMVVSHPLKWGMNLFILLYGGYSALQGSLTLGAFVVVFQFSRQLMDKYEQIYLFALSYSTYMAKIEALRGFFEQETIEDGDAPLAEPIRSLELANVTYRYKGQPEPVLREVAAELPVGGKIAFVGPSGSGKSTIAQLLVRFYDPDAGRLIVNGLDLREIRRGDWGRKLSIVFQTPFLFPDTIRSNLNLGAEERSQEEIEAACRLTDIHDFIVSLEKGYDTEIGERGIALSGGQRQRIALARAVLDNPELLILDEATSALDLETERKVQRHFDEIRKGKTTIVIAHRLSTIRNADLICVFRQGRLVEKGDHESLMGSSTVYKDMVLQVDPT